MITTYEPLTPEKEAAVRARITNNPFIASMGIQVPTLGMGYAHFVMPFRPGLANSIGLLQGGMIAALADEAVAYALWSMVPEGELISTVEMKVNFLAPVRQGPIEAKARIAKRGRTISLGDVEVWEQEQLVAKGLFTYIHLQPRPTA
ncbi:MAG: PaaI family thioesterase [Desulfobacca sp.]|uniref:PaaI family thioesterase n=1 Tax=Desulfobacca sp. TaxID=2067990 RepID=UPI00404A755E